ncbi:MAG: phosphoadenylyl-sulfate reductase [Rhodospirillales bacterium]|jgi:phosphoadenosine phosphosulfate reductase|nr:phosphoadenylyl-sulfate reductase [Rhodospirillales bacterium]
MTMLGQTVSQNVNSTFLEVTPRTDITDVYRNLEGTELLAAVLGAEHFGEIAAVSSFGADSAVLLSLIVEVAPSVPVIFLETGKHFPETLDYVETIRRKLGLMEVRLIGPDPRDLSHSDLDGELWQSSSDTCCEVRKVVPLAKALKSFDSWISGRKRFQGSDRSGIEAVEWTEGKFKINPLAHWTPDQIRSEFRTRNLPEHPLAAQNYPSIGCAPCTRPVDPGEDARSGRWPDSEKTECGIHKAPWYGANI